MRPDTWTATLSDGRTFAEGDPALVGPRSPWRQLEALVAAEGLRITEATAILGGRQVTLEADGGTLVCGQAAEWTMPLDGRPGGHARYRWVCRQGEVEWLWRLTDGVRAWEIATTPGVRGQERMPSPPTGGEPCST